MEYDNNRPFSSEGAAQERKRKHALGKGVIIGCCGNTAGCDTGVVMRIHGTYKKW